MTDMPASRAKRGDAAAPQYRHDLCPPPPGSATPAWTPFARAVPQPLDEQALRALAAQAGQTLEAARAEMQRMQREETVYVNSRYQVSVRRLPDQQGQGGALHLSIRRRDRAPVHDWRDLQRIKSELAGPEREAIEIYPPESQLVDVANQYHLWVLPAGVQVPYGFRGPRAVSDTGAGAAVQRPHDPA